MISPGQVTACLVTRGDQEEMLERIRDSLIFTNVIVWNNSWMEDWKCAGRYKAALLARTDIVYFQDDDVIVPEITQRALLASYEPDVCVANWGHGINADGYADLPLVGCGAIVDRHLPWEAIDLYTKHYPLDDDFKYEADFIVGVLYPEFKHLHLPFEINYEVAQHESRLANQPWQKALKFKMTNQARAIRDLVAA